MSDRKQLADLLAKVTPGPWYADSFYVRTTAQNQHWQIADAGHVMRTPQQCATDAALIAMAPDLARALIEALDRNAVLEATIEQLNGPLSTAALVARAEAAEAEVAALRAKMATSKRLLDDPRVKALVDLLTPDAAFLSDDQYAALTAIKEASDG